MTQLTQTTQVSYQLYALSKLQGRTRLGFGVPIKRSRFKEDSSGFDLEHSTSLNRLDFLNI